jgi:hypothetical protein
MHKASSSKEIISRMVLRIIVRPHSLSSPEMTGQVKKKRGLQAPAQNSEKMITCLQLLDTLS